MIKTNVMRKLDSLKIPHKEYEFEVEGAPTGVEVAQILNEDENKVFKTLVTVGKTNNHYVFMIPVAEELDLKKAAKAVNEKSIEMIKSKELLPLTGYIHGGCSPIGMKKFFKTCIHNTAHTFDTIIFSGGKIGTQVECSLDSLKKIIRIDEADLIVEE